MASNPSSSANSAALQQRSVTIGEVADVAGRFHRLGYNHRDFYCCHFFIRETDDGGFRVNLIDLQRVEHRRCWRRRCSGALRAGRRKITSC